MSKILRQSSVPIAAVATSQAEVGRAPSPVSIPLTATEQPTVNRASARTQRGTIATGRPVAHVLGHVKFALLLLLLPMAACKDDSLSNFLNGGSANAKSDRTAYIPGSTATQAELNRLQNYATGQSTFAMHDVLGPPDSTTPTADYYRDPSGNSLVVVPYDAEGKWTGTIESIPAPQWQPSPYPGAQ